MPSAVDYVRSVTRFSLMEGSFTISEFNTGRQLSIYLANKIVII